MHRLELALKKARETEYSLEILIESGIVESKKFNALLQEAQEIGKILVSSTEKLKEE